MWSLKRIGARHWFPISLLHAGAESSDRQLGDILPRVRCAVPIPFYGAPTTLPMRTGL